MDLKHDIKVERGQIYFVRTDNTFGAELASGRPVVVISGEEHNKSLPTVVVACLSRTVRDWAYSVPVHTSDGSTSNVICNQIKTLDKGRLTDYKGKLTALEMEQVDDAIRQVVSLPDRVVEKIVEKEVEVNSDVHELKMELEIYKKLYEKAVGQVIDLKYEKDTAKPVVEKSTVEKVVEPIKAVGEAVEKTNVDVEALKKQMGAIPKEPSKKGRRPSLGTARRGITHDDLVEFKKSGKVNVNTDSWETIAATTGMDIQTAQAIVTHRNRHGNFKDLVDLLVVRNFTVGLMNKYGYLLEV